jgi:SAM-dependent methyltransferase
MLIRRLQGPLAALFLLALTACSANHSTAGEDAPHYESATPSRDGIGKVYMGREISQVMGHLGAGWLERPERLREERTDLLVAALALQEDDVVVDLGAGTGYFSFPVSAFVPDGRVLAVDIQPEMLAIIEQRASDYGVTNVEPVLGSECDPNLGEQRVDVVLMVDAYHEFSCPREVMEAIVTALADDGRVVLVEYRGEDPTIGIKPLHTMTLRQAEKEMAAVGLVLDTVSDVLPKQHLMTFVKADSP